MKSNSDQLTTSNVQLTTLRTNNFHMVTPQIPTQFNAVVLPKKLQISKYGSDIHKNLLVLFVTLYIRSNTLFSNQKQSVRGVLRKRCSENMQQIYRRTPMPTFDFNKVAKQSNFIKIALWDGCSPVNLLHVQWRN